MTRFGRTPILVIAALSCLLTVTPAVGVEASMPSIVGGAPTSITAAPWQVFVDDGRGGRCGGSLISSQWVLTAAHCVAGVQPRALRLVMGETTVSAAAVRRGITVDRVVVHPQWQVREAIADVALLRLSRPVSFSARIRPISLPVGVDSGTWPAAGQPAWIAGWGSTRRNGPGVAALNRASVRVLASPYDERCGLYGAAFKPEAQLCAGRPAGGVDACTGDSGGGLTTLVKGGPVLIGVSSAGNGCGRAAYPGVYARVTTYVPWIQESIKN